MRLDTASGELTAKRYLVTRRRERAAILYWYQTPRRALAGEWEAKLWVALDAVRDRRTDVALVRIVVPAAEGREAQAFDAAAGFARSVYPAEWVMLQLVPPGGSSIIRMLRKYILAPSDSRQM